MYIHHMARMVRKQVYLSQVLNEKLRRAAARGRRAEAEIIRDALDRHLGAPRQAWGRVDGDALWKIVGVAGGPDGDLSERVDEYLYGAPTR